MSGTRSISTSIGITTCDVCGRTLLRGEQAQIYLDGLARRSVCELCVTRALHEGWVRELESHLEREHRFRPSRTEVVVTGICASCAAEGAPRRPRRRLLEHVHQAQ